MKSFLLKEKNVLLQILQKNREILESKDANSETKKILWEHIHEEFHSHKGVMKREVKQLRKFWENTKLRYKKLYSGSAEVNTDIFCMLQDPDYSLPEDIKEDKSGSKRDDNKTKDSRSDDISKDTETCKNSETITDDCEEDDVVYISLNDNEIKDDNDDVSKDGENVQESLDCSNEETIKSHLKLKLTLPKESDKNNNDSEEKDDLSGDTKEQLEEEDKPEIKLRISRKRKGTPAKVIQSTTDPSIESLEELCNKVPTKNRMPHLFQTASYESNNTSEVSAVRPIIQHVDSPGTTQIQKDYTNLSSVLNQSKPGSLLPTREKARHNGGRRFTSQLFNVQDEQMRYQIPLPSSAPVHKSRIPTNVNSHESYPEVLRYTDDSHGPHRLNTLNYIGASSHPSSSLYLDHFHHQARLPQMTFHSHRSFHKDTSTSTSSGKFPRNSQSSDKGSTPVTEQDFLRLQIEQEKIYHAAKLSTIKTDVELYESEHQAKMHLLAAQCNVIELQRQYWSKAIEQLNNSH